MLGPVASEFALFFLPWIWLFTIHNTIWFHSCVVVCCHKLVNCSPVQCACWISIPWCVSVYHPRDIILRVASSCGYWPLPASVHADFFSPVYGPRLVMWSCFRRCPLVINLTKHSPALCVLIRQKETEKKRNHKDVILTLLGCSCSWGVLAAPFSIFNQSCYRR